MDMIKCAVPVCKTYFGIRVVREVVNEIPNLLRKPQQRNPKTYETPKRQRDSRSSFEFDD